MTKKEVIGRYSCVDDDGNQYVVIETQDIITSQTLGGTSEMPGMKSLSLTDGSPVNFINDNTFKVVRIDTIIRKQ